MKIGKRVLSIFMILLIVLTVAPLTILKAKAMGASGQCGEHAFWNFNEETGVLRINGYGEMTHYDFQKSPWCYNNEIKHVIIENGITSISEWAFMSCKELVDVSIPVSVTTLGESLFYYCKKLSSVIIPGSIRTIPDGAFTFCDSLVEISIPNGITEIGNNAFQCCYSLENIKFPKTVTRIGDTAFASCYNLISVDLPSGLLSLGHNAFSSCDKLLEIIIPDSVTDVGYDAFYGCKSLSYVSIGKRVASLSNCPFRDCDSLISIYVNPENAFYMSDTRGCLYSKDQSILYRYPSGNTNTSFLIPYSVKTIDKPAFQNLSYLKNIFIGTNLALIKSFAFFYGFEYHNTSLTDVYYKGTQSQWNSISIEEYNNHLTDARIHFNASPEDIGEVEPHTHTPVTTTQASTCKVPGYTLITCSECSEQISFTALPLAAHQYGVWVTVKKPTETAAGLRERTCTVCGAKQKEEIPRLNVVKVEDQSTGISVSYDKDSSYDNKNVELVVEKEFDGNQYLTQSYDKINTWNIKTYIEGKVAQPEAPVTVRIPLPEGYDPNHIAVFHVNSITGVAEPIKDAHVEGKHIVFTAISFSVYIVVDENSKTDPNACPQCGKVHKGFFDKIVGFFHKIIYRLTHLFEK